MAISYAIRRGQVIEDAKGRVDASATKNRAYLLADHSVKKRAKAAGKKDGRRAAKSKKRTDLWDLNLQAQINEREARTAKLDVERARLLGMLTERRMVLAAFAAFGQEWKTQVLDMPRRLIPYIYSMCRSGKPLQGAIKHAELEVSKVTQALKEKGRDLELGDLT